MKRLLLSALALVSFVAFAQEDISITLNSPANNANYTGGQPLTLDFTISNIGTKTIDASLGDSVVFGVAINGSVIYAAFSLDTIPVGQSKTYQLPFGLTGGPSGALNFCMLAQIIGPNWNETNQTDNEDCITLNYTTNMGTSEYEMTTGHTDRSFVANNMYNVNLVLNGRVAAPRVEFYNISGQLAKTVALNGNNGNVQQEISVADLPAGIYIVRTVSEEGLISTKKVSIK